MNSAAVRAATKRLRFISTSSLIAPTASASKRAVTKVRHPVVRDLLNIVWAGAGRFQGHAGQGGIMNPGNSRTVSPIRGGHTAGDTELVPLQLATEGPGGSGATPQATGKRQCAARVGSLAKDCGPALPVGCVPFGQGGLQPHGILWQNLH